MSVFKSIGDVSRIVVDGASDVVEEIADAGRRAYCQQYTNNPYWVLVKNNLTLPIVTRTLDNFCSDFPAPPPPPPASFTGGQCEGTLYIMVCTCFSRSRFGGDPVPRSINLITVQGEITKAEGIVEEGDQLIDFVVENSTSGLLAIPQWNLSSSQRYVSGLTIDFVPDDGSPDLCGDPPSPGYPPTPPPADNDLTNNVTIVNNAGDSYEYTTTINRDVGGTIVFPGSINVNSVGVSIDIGGISVTNDNSRRSGGGGGNGGGEVFSAPEPEPEPKEVEELKEPEEIPPPVTVEKLIAVVVNLVDIPTNTDITDGRGAPDVYYAGWIEFKNKSTYYERQFINFTSQRFQAPDENDGYAITYKPGFAGQVTEITEETVE